MGALAQKEADVKTVTIGEATATHLPLPYLSGPLRSSAETRLLSAPPCLRSGRVCGHQTEV